MTILTLIVVVTAAGAAGNWTAERINKTRKVVAA